MIALVLHHDGEPKRTPSRRRVPPVVWILMLLLGAAVLFLGDRLMSVPVGSFGFLGSIAEPNSSSQLVTVKMFSTGELRDRRVLARAV